MTLLRQIDDARQALADLTTDEAELSHLEAEQLAEIQAMKVSGSKNFAGLAVLEGKRAALASMLTEQRSHIERARVHLEGLTAQKVRGEALEALKVRVHDLQARRKETDGLLMELGAFLRSHLPRIAASRMVWAADLEAAQAQAMSAFDIPQHLAGLPSHSGSAGRTAWNALFDELGEGAADALTQTPNGRHAQGMTRVYEPLTRRPAHHAVSVAQVPLLRYFDRPVSLVIAEALAEVDSVTPAPFRGGE
ncbi:hypothetical protein E7T09_12965 [Deinococcus sp. KSM4-11]|uniref:hypothetical protein n=1 Tax=Deinococcus sp. KSM4-11 TaxID=2568654 RepID=UPI0010A34E25|nr:hypothetical protein [Deinococcus sp. KSM4-11]THF86135.1 hypothetical protein E7T09_12965 [Deinococcus sp. KSM4-11]